MLFVDLAAALADDLSEKPQEKGASTLPGNAAGHQGVMGPDTTSDKPIHERRQSLRRRVLKGGVVAFNERYVTLPCAVRDISDGGARLRIDGSITVPDTFELIIEIDGLEAFCEVVSRRGNEVSVRFTSPPRMVAPRRVQVVKALVPIAPPSIRKRPKPIPSSC
jgi:hypothetical protein